LGEVEAPDERSAIKKVQRFSTSHSSGRTVTVDPDDLTVTAELEGAAAKREPDWQAVAVS
jgi:hypothetical protein